MVPGYVDASEVEAIAEFIADLDPSILYRLLVFHPAHHMKDLPVTPMAQAVECYRAACRHLERVNIGNMWLLGIRNLSQLHSMSEKL